MHWFETGFSVPPVLRSSQGDLSNFAYFCVSSINTPISSNPIRNAVISSDTFLGWLCFPAINSNINVHYVLAKSAITISAIQCGLLYNVEISKGSLLWSRAYYVFSHKQMQQLELNVHLTTDCGTAKCKLLHE